MSEPAIRVEGISYSYDGHLAVDDIGFTVAPGEILGFLGPNGAGKSTTIKMLTGQLKPQAGTITILGMNMPAQATVIQARIGVAFEEKNLYGNMSARENLIFFGRLFGIANLDPDSLLRRVGLADRAADRVAEFSKGMKQRLMIARVLINTPDVLFLDEPTDGLDPVSSQSIRQVIREEALRGAAVLLTTHDMTEADKLSDRVAFIDEGRVLVTDTPENLKQTYGRRSVKIRARRDGEVVETVIPLDDQDADERIRQAVAQRNLLTIHTEEATLEDIFIHFAGRGLEA
ncbi:fluoroquinolones export ATP-binding protein/MT2762 [bacterium BMS3Abin02]|nr:fluoroquinolones export ATP-binding protein/MT2762 [bacterium BMS3Abin02]GBE22380.1 fluoroquinolones export ATP-binding protein/MT2762 [bacterium BMS3Bbin01]HDH26546.1 ABC transporter ATP-binding protein [Actinomycetota bacterium]HDK44695.1 ABC transporter ATP-binding protein [Actinomycetota bacterium]